MPLVRKIRKSFTYADYLQWDDSFRVELINGDVYDMTPAPSQKHQEISMSLSVIIGSFLKGRKCKVLAAPFDVRLPDKGTSNEEIITVVQPDISIVCDTRKLDQNGCIGAPDIIVEIVSPDSAAKDMRDKLALYEKHGVKEYWIINPLEKTLMVFQKDAIGSYNKPLIFSPPDKYRVKNLKGLLIDLSDIF